MKISFSLLVVIISLCTFSCKKDKSEIPAPAQTAPKLKSLVIVGINSVSYQYDNSGRIAKVTYADGSFYTYTYASKQVDVEVFYPTGVSQFKRIYQLNESGLLAVSYYATIGLSNATYYTYNEAKQNISEITKVDGAVTYQNYHTYDLKGNRILDSTITINGTTINEYEFYPDVISTVENKNCGQDIMGLSNNNYPKKSTYKNAIGVVTSTLYSIPETDALGRITKAATSNNGATPTVYLYTYY